MKAAVLTEFSHPIDIQDIPMPDLPKNNELLIKVAAVGICGTDLKIWKGKKNSPLPLIMGHEISGTVVQVGEGINSIKVGDKGIVHFYCSCYTCNLCKSNNETLCQNMQGRLGFTKNGGMQEYITIKVDNFIPIKNSNVKLENACIITDAIATAYRGLKKARIKQGERVLIVGLGGVGMHAMQVANALGGDVIGIDIDRRKIDFALTHGLGRAMSIEEILTEGKERFDVVVETVSRSQTFAADFALLAPTGRIVLLGYGDPNVSIDPYSLILKEISILSSRASSRKDISEALDLVSAGLVKPIISKYLPLENINEALRTLDKGDIIGRQVIVFSHMN